MRLKKVRGAEEKLQSHSKVLIELSEKIDINTLFPSPQPLHIEIGMGKGQFIIGMAKQYPEYNFIGIEKFDSVLVRAIERFDEMEEKPTNLHFLRFDAETIEAIFEENSVSTIYLNFSDPWPKTRHAKRRLTPPQFLKQYAKLLKEDGALIQKTDNIGLFASSIKSLSKMQWWIEDVSLDLHHDEKLNAGNVQTEYEMKFAQNGEKINYLKARLALFEK